MKALYTRTWFALAAGVVLGLGTTSLAGDDGFTPLFNGKDMSDFKTVGGSDKTWRVENGTIVCTGRPNGYFATKKSYRNYVLRFDFRYPVKPGNSGYLIHITGKDRVWPKCVEVQGHYGGVCSIFPISGAKGPRPKVNTELRNKVRKPHKEWNSMEIVVKNGGITAKLNGSVICEAKEGSYNLKEGPIGFQSEGAPIDFRKLRIRVMD